MPYNDIIHKKMLEIADGLHALYLRKNHDYGDSFSISYKEYGLTMSFIRIEDKLRRLEKLSQAESQVKDESIQDTLLDVANYAIMTEMELKADQVGKKVPSKEDLHSKLLFEAICSIIDPHDSAEGFCTTGVLHFAITCIKIGLNKAKEAPDDQETAIAFSYIAAFAILGYLFLTTPSLLPNQEEYK